MERHGPPTFWERLAERTAPGPAKGDVVGDLREEYENRVLPELGPREARAWYRGQVVRSLPHFLRLRFSILGRVVAAGRGEGFMSTFLQDLRYGLRGIRHNSLFSFVVVLTLALGIGANTTIYSIIDGVVFRPFPFPEPETLVDIGSEYPRLNRPLSFIEHLSPAEFEDLRDETATLTDVVAWDMGNRQIASERDAANVFTGFWWGNGFRALRVQPHLGRGFLPEETENAAQVAVISHRLWQTNFGSDPAAVGTTIEVNTNPHEIVGVMPEGTLLYGMDLWIPMPVGPEVFSRNRRQFQVIGRIAPDRSMTDVAAELEGLARRTELEFASEFPEYADFRLTPVTWTEANVRQFRVAALVLLGAVAAVMLIVCANIANLLLSRSSNRRREVSVRTALGASRVRLLRQLLTESVTLSLLGGIIGIGFAVFGVRWARGLLDTMPFVSGTVELNGRTMAYTAAVAVLAGVVFGLAPALHTLAVDLRGVLTAEGGGSTGSRSRGRLQSWFVGAEVALAMLLLFGGGLLINSLIRLNRADPGFEHEELITMRLTVPWEEYSGEQIGIFFESLAEQVRSVPGVRSATVGSQFPPLVFSRTRVALAGQEALEEGTLPTSYITQVGDAYFEALGVPLLTGRVLGPQDHGDTPLVAVVNEVFRDRYLSGRSALGETIRIGTGDDPEQAEIVGVVASTRNRGFTEGAQPEIFGSVRQLSGSNNQLFLIIRTLDEPGGIVGAVRGIVREMDPDQPIYAIRTMDEVFAAQTTTQSLAATSLGAFGAFALALAALGIYAVVAYAVTQRRREIGLRMALGASSKNVRAIVVTRALAPVAIGTVLGAAGAVVLGRGLASLLYEIEGTDPSTLLAACLLFGGVAAVASYLPARRASLLDPAHALRED